MGAVEETLRVGGYMFHSCDATLVARGSTVADAYQIGSEAFRGKEILRFVTVGLGSGAILPPAKEGLSLTVINTGVNPLQLYGNGSDTINGTAGSTGVAVAANGIFRLVCPVDATWYGS